MSPKENPKKTHFRKAQNFTGKRSEIRFRLLCSISAAGGVIGRVGSVIKRLEEETSTKITVDDGVSSSCKERLIHVTGSSIVNRKLRLSGGEEVEVSAAQVGLLRVFNRIMEVDSSMEVDGDVRCRLLVEPGLVGAVMGEKGCRILKICRETGGFVKAFSSPEFLPLCAKPSDELILIKGGIQAVRKALIEVSRYIQEKTSRLLDDAKVASAVLRPSIRMETVDAATNGRVNGSVVAEVVFRMLCPYDLAGFVIGYRGRKVKALEEETKASIQFSSPDEGYHERLVTVSAVENRKTDHSCAQNALVRVFNELTSSGEIENVIARLLVLSSQLRSLDVLRDSIACISKATGATLQLLEQKYVRVGDSTDEKVIQIDGEYPSVQIALFQVSWMLRESTFDTIEAKNKLPLLPHNMFNLPRPLSKMAALTEEMKTCGVTEDVNGSLLSDVKLSEDTIFSCLSTSMEQPRDSTTVEGDREHDSGKNSVIVTNTKIEITVRADVFTSIFGDDGSNLSRLRMVSGAKVEVCNPLNGGDGQIIISGAPDQTSAGQSLLQAYIISAV